MQRLSVVLAVLLGLSALASSQTSAAGTQDAASNHSTVHPKGDYVTVNGARLWYESEGSGEPLILISGGPGISHDYFHPYFSALRDSYRVIYFDAFGRGKSDRAKDRREYTLARDVEDVDGLRKALGLGKINLLGHSYGGVVAQSYAVRFPDSLRRLILIDAPFSGEMWQSEDESSNNELHNQFPETWEKLEQIHSKGLNTCSKEYQDAGDVSPAFLMFYNAATFEEKLMHSDGSINNDVYCAIAGDDADFMVSGDISKIDFRLDLGKFTMPTLILAGRYDRVVIPRWSVQFKRYAPQAQFVMFEKSGHFPFIEETGETVRVLREFLQRK
jgi:proline iminopeptidase